MVGQQPWRPRCCDSCGEPLEEYRYPLEPGAYVSCIPCARLYVVDELDGVLIPVVLAPDFVRTVFNDLLAAYWASAPPPAGERRPTERRAA